MELKQLIEDCNEAINDAVQCGEYNADMYDAKVQTNGAYIDVFLIEEDGYYTAGVDIYHDNDHESPNLEGFLADRIDIDWDAAHEAWREADIDVYQRNGFASAADFLRWKEGR